MKKSILFLSLFFSFTSVLLSQETVFFQQKVGFLINVTLNDLDHSLSGDIDINYTNNSKDELSFIYIHLWPNAYKNESTAFAKQAKEQNSAKSFFYADESDRGYIDQLNFMVDGKEVNWDYDPDHQDIAIVNLPKPLKPSETISISTPFFVKIPQSFSRLGHVGQSYQITQWYPKPAVYDHKGWHPMPYLNLGEFYSEFGDFEVNLTLPENYVVGATGVLETKSELEFLNRKITETKGKTFKEPFDGVKEYASAQPSSEKTKTIRYTAGNVHDFAWFADKTFHVVKDKVALESGKEVDTYVMFTDFEGHLWKDAINYVNRAVKFYSEEVGEYPYPQATAVQSALSAGAGMEYPMITVIGESDNAHDLDIVITHEVGHNWFYGILGSNERVHPWMDEGMNSFYERKYDRKYYQRSDSLSNMVPDFMTKIVGIDHAELSYHGYLFFARQAATQPIETHSADLTSFSYFLNAYDRPAAVLRYLEQYLGEAKFKQVMQKYYSTWQFSHPYPEDFQKLFEEETGEDLAWFFDDILGTKGEKYIDYALKAKDGSSVTVKNKGEIKGPFSISTLKDGEIVSTTWHEGFEGSQKVNLPAGEHDEVQIDAIRVIPEINRKNNGQKRPLKVNLLANIENADRRSVNITPLIAYNNVDRFMFGAAFHNLDLISQKIEYTIAPMFSTGSINKERVKPLGYADIVGIADVKYNGYFRKGAVKRVAPGVSLRSFNFNYNPFKKYHEKYIRIAPYVDIDLRQKSRTSTVSQSFRVTVPIVMEQDARLERPVDTFQFFGYDKYKLNPGFIASYQYKKSGINSFTLNPMVEYRQITNECNQNKEGYVKVSVEGVFKYNYVKNRALKIRFYAAALPFNNQGGCSSNISRPINLISKGTSDYFYDDYYIGRNTGVFDGQNLWGQQINPNREGGFRAPIAHDASVRGESDLFAFTTNLTFDLPFQKFNSPIKPYLDIGVNGLKEPGALDSPLFMVFGLALEFGDVFGLYVPLAGSENIMNSVKGRGSIFNRIGFKLDLHKANPRELVRNIRL